MKVNFGGVEETVVTRKEFSLEDARNAGKNERIAILGYGPQGQGQSQNLKDNGFKVVVGVRDSSDSKSSWQRAIADGWVPGETLFPIADAAQRGTIVANLLGDAAQPTTWADVKPFLTPGKALYVSHGMPIHFHEATGIVAPRGVDVIMIAPKGAGRTVRSNFKNGSGINASFSVERDATGRASERVKMMGIGIGAGYLFETTAAREVISDHVGERAILLGEYWALAELAYHNKRQAGKTTMASFIDSSEQMTQVITPMIGRSGADEIYAMALAQGHLDEVLLSQNMARRLATPIMDRLYASVVEGKEAATSLRENSRPDYRKRLEMELSAIESEEMWRVGKKVRAESIDRNYHGVITNWGLAGALLGAIEAQYCCLIKHGHSPSEAGNESCEELTQSLNPIYQARGVAELLRACSTTAQRGSLDWGPIFMHGLMPAFSTPLTYFDKPLTEIRPHYTQIDEDLPNIWDVMAKVRELRPENQKAA